MAGPVKGTWGGEDIELNDAATETTLLKLLEAVNRMGSGGGAGGSGNAADEVERLADESKNTTKNVEELGDAADDAASSLSRGFAVLGQSAKDLVGEFLVGGNSISDFTAHITGAIAEIPLIGGIIAAPAQIFANVLNNNIASFRELSSVGVDFGTSLFDIQQAATRSGLSLATFQTTISNNSETLAKFGGGAAEGARRFQQVSGILQKDFGPQFSALGMTMEETAQFTADYMELQTTLGRNQKMDARSQAQGTAAYVMQLDQLAKVTGKQRDQVADLLQQQANDERMKALLMTMDEDARKSLQGVTATIAARSPELADAVTELVATGGVGLSEAGQDLAREAPELAKAAARLREGTITQEEFAKVMDHSVKSAQRRVQADGKTLAIQAQMGTGFGKTALMMASYGDVVTDLTAVEERQKKQMESGSKGLLDFERRLTEARNMIFGALIDSGVFQTLETAFGGLTDMLTNTNSEGFKKFKTVIQDVSAVVKDFMDTFMEGMSDPDASIGDAIMKAWDKIEPTVAPAFEKIMNKLGEVGASMVSSLFDALLPDLDTVIVGILGGIGAALLAPFVGIPALIATGIIGGLTAMFGYEKIKEFFSAGWDALMAVPNAIMDVFSGEGSIRGVFDAALDAVFFIPNMILDLFDIGPVSELFESAVDSIFAVPNAIMDFFGGTGTFRDVFNSALDAVFFPFNMILDLFEIGPISQTFSSAIDAIFAIPNKVMEFFKSDVAQDFFSKAWNAITFVPNKILELFDLPNVSELLSIAWGKITAIPQKFMEMFGIDGLEIPSISDMFAGIINVVKDFFNIDIELPSISDFMPDWLGGGDKKEPESKVAADMTDKRPGKFDRREELRRVKKIASEMGKPETAAVEKQGPNNQTDGVNEQFDQIKGKLDKLSEKEKKSLELQAAIGMDFDTALETAGEDFDKLLESSDSFDAALEGAGSKFDKMLEDSGDFDAALEGAGSSFDDILDSSSSKFDDALAGIGSSLETTAVGAGEVLKSSFVQQEKLAKEEFGKSQAQMEAQKKQMETLSALGISTSDPLANLNPVQKLGLGEVDTNELSSYNNEIKALMAEIKASKATETEAAAVGDATKDMQAQTTGGAMNSQQDKLDKLNTTMERMLAAVSEGNNISGKSLKAFKNNTSSVW